MIILIVRSGDASVHLPDIKIHRLNQLHFAHQLELRDETHCIQLGLFNRRVTVTTCNVATSIQLWFASSAPAAFVGLARAISHKRGTYLTNPNTLSFCCVFVSDSPKLLFCSLCHSYHCSAKYFKRGTYQCLHYTCDQERPPLHNIPPDIPGPTLILCNIYVSSCLVSKRTAFNISLSKA